ncbi:MAG: NAD(P)/FAD-dependent oxidoreductase [Bryobacteraceae bacterium]|nr:NAD(P)/FAD-dependent oxidoreductase [Bryobacteraceae bacterium]
MTACDVLIVGGGPAGSACAAKLARSGMDVVVLDRALFPRDKPCAGWITPEVLARTGLDPGEYARQAVIEPLEGFRVSLLGGRAVEIDFGHPVSYAIRRCEFDTYLLGRSGARVRSGSPVESIERRDGRWIVNGEWEAPVLIGAGGHFCPVARRLGAVPAQETAVAAQEAEFEMSEAEAARCMLAPGWVDLAFAPDLCGYGWCVRKGRWLNIGFGTLIHSRLKPQLDQYIASLRRAQILPDSRTPAFHGHAYLLRAAARRPLFGEGVLLAGDAAGLAFDSSGEGILPAIISGRLAAEAVLEAGLRPEKLDGAAYALALSRELGARGEGWRAPGWLQRAAAPFAFRSAAFVRREILEKRFLRRESPE